MSSVTENRAGEGAVSPRPPSGGRVLSLDGLRATVAIWVVANHLMLTVYALGPNFPGAALVSGEYRVAAFMAISGFSLALPLARSGKRQVAPLDKFFARRLVRIFPPYWISIAFSVLLISTVIGEKTGTHWDVVLPLSWMGVLVHALLLQDVFSARSPNHVYWTLALEFHNYLLFPFVAVLWRKFGTRFLLGLIAVLTVASPLDVLGKWQTNLKYFDVFVMGIAAAALALGDRPKWLKHSPWWLLSLGMTALVLGVLLTQDVVNDNRFALPLELMVGVAVSAFMAHLVTSPKSSISNRLLGSRPFVFLGTFSYSLYLIHAPLLQIAWQLFCRPNGLTGGAAVAVLLACTPAIGLLSWLYSKWFEQPFAHGLVRDSLVNKLVRFWHRLARTDRVSQETPAPRTA